VNVRQRLPIGGNSENPGATTGWIEPGRQELDGYHALWYARSRWSTSDFDRMRRQRCVIGAITQQADPVKVARNFPSIAKAARQNIQTDIALGQLDAWVELAKRVQRAQVRSLPFTNDVINTANPDYRRVHALVRRTLDPPATVGPPGTPPPSAGTARGSTPSPRAGTSPSNPPAPAPADVRDVC
jgi:anionic cell wall polymer biosynthesis LytR-Cps2A-Psr (LCP) family protein